MRLKNRTLLLIGASLLALLSLPASFSDQLRGKTISFFSSIWTHLSKSPEDLTKEQLLLKNRLLENEIASLKELLQSEYALIADLKEISTFAPKENLERHQKEILNQFNIQLTHLPARVIYRPINAWSSFFWIDKGEFDNEKLNRTVIAKNSPVVVGTAVVGVIDFVTERQARVRLITDSTLKPSVRVKRNDWLLAKGELNGKSEAILRKNSTLLKGSGFNYDYPDSFGPARDLRTGEPLEKNSSFPTIPLIKVDDLLVTTGMDGVFPANLSVGIVKKIFPLKEGDYFYELEAESLLKDFASLNVVFVLPPI